MWFMLQCSGQDPGETRLSLRSKLAWLITCLCIFPQGSASGKSDLWLHLGPWERLESSNYRITYKSMIVAYAMKEKGIFWGGGTLGEIIIIAKNWWGTFSLPSSALSPWPLRSHCFSGSNVCTDPLRILFKCRLKSVSLVLGPRNYTSIWLPILPSPANQECWCAGL